MNKYNSFSDDSIIKIESLAGKGKIVMKNVNVKDPNNPANLIEAKLIVFTI